MKYFSIPSMYIYAYLFSSPLFITAIFEFGIKINLKVIRDGVLFR